jgi:NADH:ubiquinone oxidoreductase subunit C
MITNVIPVTTETLLAKVGEFFLQKYRLVTISCTDLGEYIDVLYHFDKNYEITNLRLRLERNQPVPSISSIYFSAVIVENEIKDLFGVPVEGLVLDYEGKMMLAEASPKAPQANCPVATPPAQ